MKVDAVHYSDRGMTEHSAVTLLDIFRSPRIADGDKWSYIEKG